MLVPGAVLGLLAGRRWAGAVPAEAQRRATLAVSAGAACLLLVRAALA